MSWEDKESDLSTIINTAAHVLWLASSALLSFHYRVKDWLTSVYCRWKWRNIDYNSNIEDPHVAHQLLRQHLPTFSQLKAQNKLLATECLEYYNASARHPIQSLEYVLASEDVPQLTATCNNTGAWIHGNFVARPRKKGRFFTYLYGPRTLFFFELNLNGAPLYRDRVVTCTPLDDVSVDGTYSFLGFLLPWANKRRIGMYDCICQTCGVRYFLPLKTLPCGHEELEPLCRMCFLHSSVLHPGPGNFHCGHQEGTTFGYFGTCI